MHALLLAGGLVPLVAMLAALFAAAVDLAKAGAAMRRALARSTD